MGSEEKSPSRPGQGSWQGEGAGRRRQDAGRGGHSRGRGRRLGRCLGDSVATSPGLRAPGRGLPLASEVPRPPGSGASQDPAHPGPACCSCLAPPQPTTGLRVFLPHTVTLHLRRHHSFDVSQLPNPPITPPPTGFSIFLGGGQRGLGCCQRTSWDHHATKAAESA